MSIEAKPDTTEPMLTPDVVLQMARELLRFYSKQNNKPYTCDVLADCIATIENLQSRLTIPTAQDAQGKLTSEQIMQVIRKVTRGSLYTMLTCKRLKHGINIDMPTFAAEMLAEEFRAMVSRLHCAWPNCDQPSGYDYCYEHCLNNLAHPSHNRAQVE